MSVKTKKRVAVAMSGGVDSSVAALLLAERGYEVVGVTMRLFEPPTDADGSTRFARSCCSLDDVEDARAVCRAIGARHLYLNFEKEFGASVIDYFVSEYENGRTPHPCIACNDRMKFDFLMRRANAIDADLVATGHYARTELADGKWRIRRGVDLTKDQSYVLFGLRQAQLARLLFPVGEFTKTEIRQIARRVGARVADKPDSQEICFIPYGNYKEFVEARLKKPRGGRLVDAAGATLGAHNGVHNFTIGQRRGLPLNGASGGRKLYVTAIDAVSGDVTVGEASALARAAAYASRVNWVAGAAPSAPIAAKVKIRYTGVLEDATVFAAGDWARVVFKKPMRAVTPGQAVVFYDGDVVLGGGFIELRCPPEVENALSERRAGAAAA